MYAYTMRCIVETATFFLPLLHHSVFSLSRLSLRNKRLLLSSLRGKRSRSSEVYQIVAARKLGREQKMEEGAGGGGNVCKQPHDSEKNRSSTKGAPGLCGVAILVDRFDK